MWHVTLRRTCIGYTDLVGRLKHSVLVRLVTVFLLTWTGIDLAVPQVCAAEQLASPQAAAGLLAVDHHRAGNPLNPAADTDCFCCSHAVMSSVAPNLDVVATVTLRDFPASSAHPHSVARPLYHPPQAIQL